MQPPTAILFVCLGNICRSPLAEGVFRDALARRGMTADFTLDSAGTGGWHAGSAPDPRSIAVAANHGVNISTKKARRIRPRDFEQFDLILGMDRSNVEALMDVAPPSARCRIHRFLEFAGLGPHDVPDPYYGGPDGFSKIYRMIREASEMLADRPGWRTSTADSGQASSIT